MKWRGNIFVEMRVFKKELWTQSRKSERLSSDRIAARPNNLNQIVWKADDDDDDNDDDNNDDNHDCTVIDNDNDDSDNNGLKYNFNNCNKYLRFHLSLAAVENCKYRNPDESTFFWGGGQVFYGQPDAQVSKKVLFSNFLALRNFSGQQRVSVEKIRVVAEHRGVQWKKN